MKKVTIRFIVLIFVLFIAFLTYVIYQKQRIRELEKKSKIYESVIDSVFFQTIEYNRNNYSTNCDDVIIINKRDSNNLSEYLKKYAIEVGVTNIDGELDKFNNNAEVQKKLLSLNHIEELILCVYYSKQGNYGYPPHFPYNDFKKKLKEQTIPPEIIDIPGYPEWELVSFKGLELDFEKTIEPYFKINQSPDELIPIYNPYFQTKNKKTDYTNRPEKYDDSLFYYFGYDSTFTFIHNFQKDTVKVRIFNIVFIPPFKAGIYYLICWCRTNRIVRLNYNIPKSSKNIRLNQLTINRDFIRSYLENLYKNLKMFKIPYFQITIDKKKIYIELHVFNHAIANSKEIAISLNNKNAQKKIELYRDLVMLYMNRISKESIYTAEGRLEFSIKVEIK